MLDELRRERRVILAIMGTWLAIIAVVAGLALLTVGRAHGAPAKKLPKPKPPEAAECVPVLPEHWDKLRKSGLEHEIITDPLAVQKIAAAIHTDQPIKMPTKIVVVFIGEIVKVGLLVDDKLCQILEGPAHTMRMLLQHVHGQSTSAA